MTFKIEKAFVGRKTVIRLSGRVQSEHIDEIKMQLVGEPAEIALDLDGVRLVDLGVVQFLNLSQRSGIELLNCCPYIREWMVREQDRKQ